MGIIIPLMYLKHLVHGVGTPEIVDIFSPQVITGWTKMALDIASDQSGSLDFNVMLRGWR